MVLNVKSFMSLCIQVSKTQKAAFDLQYLAPTYPFNSCGNGVRFHTAVFWLYFSQISNVICHINLTSDQLKKVSVVSLQSGVSGLMFSHGLFHLKYRRKGRGGGGNTSSCIWISACETDSWLEQRGTKLIFRSNVLIYVVVVLLNCNFSSRGCWHSLNF